MNLGDLIRYVTPESKRLSRTSSDPLEVDLLKTDPDERISQYRTVLDEAVPFYYWETLQTNIHKCQVKK